MNSTFRFAAKACLVTATSGLLLSPAMNLVAEDGSGPASKPPASKRVQQTAAVQSADQDSAVQKELQKLYRKNRREMPSMDMSEAPNTQGPIPPQTNAVSRPGAPLSAATPSAPAAAPAAAAEPRANWFERTFHVGRGKRKPAPTAEYAAPAQSRNAPYRMTTPTQPARPANPAYPAYRAPLAAGPGYQAPPTGMNPGLAPPPVVAGPAASAPPAQPQLREPAPLAPSTTARELTVRPQQQPMQQRPPTVRPARPRVSSQPMLDESGAGNDTESLDLEDAQPKAPGQAPQILSNRNESQGTPASPYSGLKISPNEAEQQITSQPQKPALEDSNDEDVEDLASSPKTAQPIVTEPADEKPAVATPAKPRTGLAPKDDDDEDDDEEDDEDMLSFPTAKADGKPRALPETAVLKAAKMLEKLDAPMAAATKAVPPTAPAAAAPAASDEKTEKSSAGPAAAPADVAAKPASITAEAAKAVITPAPATVANPAAPAVAAAPATSAPAAPAAVPAAPVVTPPAIPAVDATPSSPIGGLKGICPVALKDYRKLIDAQAAIHSTYKGKTYNFSTVEAKQAFDENPHKYAPVRGGSDVVLQTSGKAEVAGSLEHAAWYRGRLYLFSTAESRHEFVDTPSKFVVED